LIRDDFLRVHLTDEGLASETIELALDNLHKTDIAKRKTREEARKAEKLARKAQKKDEPVRPNRTKKKPGKSEHPLKKENSDFVDPDLRICLEVLVQGVEMGQGEVVGDAYNRIYRVFNDAFINEEQDFLLDRILKKFQEIRI
jgi:hypothetical protein